jgi:hypothetical protein
MPPRATTSTATKIVLLYVLVTLTLLAPVCNVHAATSCSSDACANVSPGKYAQNLGVDFPTFTTVKLTYPNGSILTDSVGDLLFTVNLTKVGHYSSIDIYVPPDFTGLTTSHVWTSFTNNYNPNSLSLGSGDSNIGPNWSRISVKNLTVTSTETHVASRIFKANQTQYVRAFKVTSPSIAGRYFFKVFINGTSIGAGNFPTVVAKASRDPAYISGTLRDLGSTNPSLAGQPISISNGTGARILATGRDYLGRSVAAQAFINDTAQGQFTLFGVAPGTYNLTAYAAGYVPTTSPARVSVLATQSLEGVSINMRRSVNITGTVWSIGGDGEHVPWASVNRSAIRIEILTLDGAAAASTRVPYSPFLSIPATATSFDFSMQYQVGLDGRIPQDSAGYTSGLAAGDYLLWAYSTSYIQYEEVRVHVGNDTKLVRSDIRLLRIGSFRVTAHFKELDSTLTRIAVPNGTLTVEAFNADGNVGGRNSTRVPAGSTYANVTFACPPGNYHLFASFSASQDGDLFYQTDDVQAWIGLGEALVDVSLWMVRGGGMNLTLGSVDAERPAVARSWAFPGAPINIKMTDTFGNVYTTNATQLGTSSFVHVSYVGLLTGDYSIIVQTFGYSQREIIRVHVVLGGNSDAIVWMEQNPRIDLTIVFKTEGLLSPIDSTLPFAQPINNIDSTPARMEVFDKYGNLVGANVTYVPNLTTTAKITVAGLNRYYGDPRFTWSGFYDTTDAVQQDEGGLLSGDYMIRIWVDGYYQPELVHITLPTSGNMSIVTPMERASRVSGTVLGPDLNGEALLQSWAIVDLEPGDFTTFSVDGNYQVWVPSGSYGIGVSLPGYATFTSQVDVPDGSDIKADFWLDDPQTGSADFVSIVFDCSWLAVTPLMCLVFCLRDEIGFRGITKNPGRWG